MFYCPNYSFLRIFSATEYFLYLCESKYSNIRIILKEFSRLFYQIRCYPMKICAVDNDIVKKHLMSGLVERFRGWNLIAIPIPNDPVRFYYRFCSEKFYIIEIVRHFSFCNTVNGKGIIRVTKYFLLLPDNVRANVSIIHIKHQ